MAVSRKQRDEIFGSGSARKRWSVNENVRQRTPFFRLRFPRDGLYLRLRSIIMADSYRIGPYGPEFMISQKAGMDSDVTDKLPAGDYELRANSETLRCRRNRRRFLFTRGDGGHPRTVP